MSNNVVIIVADDVPVGTVVAVAKRADSQVRAVVAGSRELAESVAGAGVASVCWVPQPEGVPTEALASVVAQLLACLPVPWPPLWTRLLPRR